MKYDNQALSLHCRPSFGWVNDPNGLVQFSGYYHIFYQHARDHIRPWQEPISWGHSRTKDFIHWEELPEALIPGDSGPYDAHGCWSGTSAVKDGVLYLFYASITEEDRQTVSVAYSTDGIRFEKYAGNPVIRCQPSDGSFDFRDPAVAVDGQTAYLVMASSDPDHTEARLLLYKSADLFSWNYVGILARWPDCRYAECPSFVKLQDGRWLLAASTVECGTDRKRFYVMRGRFDGSRFDADTVCEPQKGPDQYAGLVFRDDRGRPIMISWIPGWHFADFGEACVGCMSVPMEITFEDGGGVRMFPVEECRHLLTDSDPSVLPFESGLRIPRSLAPDVTVRETVREVKILRDEYVLELFFNGGESVYTVLLC